MIEQAKKKGETLPTEERFDSNCITPGNGCGLSYLQRTMVFPFSGTVFMARLHEQLKYFVNMKVTTDDMWQGIRIYLSGHDVSLGDLHMYNLLIPSMFSGPWRRRAQDYGFHSLRAFATGLRLQHTPLFVWFGR